MTSILARYTDATKTTLTRSDMPGCIIPAVQENRHFAEVVALGLDIAPAEAVPVNKEAVKAEAQRRILALYPVWKQRNMALLAATLTAKGAGNWTTEEQTQWNDITAAWDKISAIRSRSNEIEAMDPISLDLTDDETWDL